MATAMRAVRDSAAANAGRGSVATPVIADRGDSASVVVVRASRRLRLGDRFAFAGATWEVTRAGDAVRGFVARPVAQA